MRWAESPHTIGCVSLVSCASTPAGDNRLVRPGFVHQSLFFPLESDAKDVKQVRFFVPDQAFARGDLAGTLFFGELVFGPFQR